MFITLKEETAMNLTRNVGFVVGTPQRSMRTNDKGDLQKGTVRSGSRA
jgi:hypothetical protein